MLQEEPAHLGVAIEAGAASEETFHGRPISPGLAEGRARVISSLGEATNVLSGEILVCREPLFELSPLFSIVSAVVAEVGGLLDHSATLVREYGIPAVFGVEAATTKIHTGDELQIDANKGIIARRKTEPEWSLL